MAQKSCPVVVVLLGAGGSGKTALAQTAAGRTGSLRPTTVSTPFDCPDRGLRIMDTPGLLEGDEERAIEISRAVNSGPVTKLLITVKAHMRTDVTLQAVHKHAERFLDLGDTLLGLCVTHMDTVTWSKDDFSRRTQGIHDFGPPIFVSKDTKGEEILNGILDLCQGQEARALAITGENFLTCFNVAEMHLGAKRVLQDEVANVKRLMASLSDEVSRLPPERQRAAVADFSEWVQETIFSSAKGRLAANSSGSHDMREGMQVELMNQLTGLLYHPTYLKEELRACLRERGDRSFTFTLDGQRLLLRELQPQCADYDGWHRWAQEALEAFERRVSSILSSSTREPREPELQLRMDQLRAHTEQQAQHRLPRVDRSQAIQALLRKARSIRRDLEEAAAALPAQQSPPGGGASPTTLASSDLGAGSSVDSMPALSPSRAAPQVEGAGSRASRAAPYVGGVSSLTWQTNLLLAAGFSPSTSRMTGCHSDGIWPLPPFWGPTTTTIQSQRYWAPDPSYHDSGTDGLKRSRAGLSQADARSRSFSAADPNPEPWRRA